MLRPSSSALFRQTLLRSPRWFSQTATQRGLTEEQAERAEITRLMLLSPYSVNTGCYDTETDDCLAKGCILLILCMLYASCHDFSGHSSDAPSTDTAEGATTVNGFDVECSGNHGSRWNRLMSDVAANRNS